MKPLLMILLVVGLTACATTHEVNVSEDRKAQFKIAQLSEQSGQYQSALNLYQRLYDDQPSDEISLALGRLYYRQGEWIKAQTHLEEVGELSPLNQEARLWLTRTHLRLANPAKALAYIPSPVSDDTWANLNAVALDYMQQHDAAQDIYLSVAKSSPLNTRVRRNLVYSYLLEGDYESARDQLNILYELGYRNEQFTMLDAIVTLLQSDSEHALRQLEQFSTPYEVERFAAQLRQLREP